MPAPAVKDMNLDPRVLTVRNGKGGKDRQVVLPKSLLPELTAHVNTLRTLCEADRHADLPGVWLPEALSVKYPNAGKELA